MANIFIRAIAVLATPIVEEATARIYHRRIADAEARGYQDIKWFNYLMFGRVANLSLKISNLALKF